MFHLFHLGDEVGVFVQFIRGVTARHHNLHFFRFGFQQAGDLLQTEQPVMQRNADLIQDYHTGPVMPDDFCHFFQSFSRCLNIFFGRFIYDKAVQSVLPYCDLRDSPEAFQL